MNGFGKARKAAGYTQQKVSELTGIPLSTLRRWEQGVNEPDVASIVKLADLYKCSTDIMIGSNYADWYPHGLANAESVSTDEKILLNCFRACTPQYREMLLATARSFRDSSKESAVGSKSYGKAVNE